MDDIFIALDVETTGLDYERDEIIEVAAIKFRRHEIIDTFQHFVKPQRALPLKIKRLTGIQDDDLANAPLFREIIPPLRHFLETYPIVGHSISFDMTMLRTHGMECLQPCYDTFDLATLLLPNISTYALGNLADHLGIPQSVRHRAFDDADVCRQVFLMLIDRVEGIDITELDLVNRMMEQTDWSLRTLFYTLQRARAKHTWTTSPTSESAAPSPRTPSLLANLPTDLSDTALKPTKNTEPLSASQIDQFFAPGGALSTLLPMYEQRAPQVTMAHAVQQAFQNSSTLLIEAGTGTGKSMAYLVPAVFFAVQRGERVIVSTNTINLQDQLFWKDIPDLQKTIATADDTDVPFKAALLKGRGNYLCLRRYKTLRPDIGGTTTLSPDEARALIKVHFWLPTTTSGDRNELRLVEREQNAWSRMNVTPETCTGRFCPDFSECFFFRARRKAEAAHIVVVNHALLLADLATDSGVLPTYDHLILDEAHNLEDVATNQLGFEVDQIILFDLFDKLYKSGGALNVSGIFSELETVPLPPQSGLREKIQRIYQEVSPIIERARRGTYDFFLVLDDFVQGTTQESSGKRYRSDRVYDERIRLVAAVRQRPQWADVEQAWNNLRTMMLQIGGALNDVVQLFLDHALNDSFEQNELLQRVQWLAQCTTDICTQTEYIINGHEEKICWLTRHTQSETLSLHAVPLSVADILQTQLFSQKQTVILTSATLSISDSFAFIKSRIGLDDADELLLHSPFDYEHQSLVYLLNDIPEPNERGHQQALEQAMTATCIAAGGRTLALFTANTSLRQTYESIQEALEREEIALLGQGMDGSRRMLLERFKESPRTVLFGTSSFWEGVDVAGEALSVLVITKLPFNVPTDPVFAARSEQFRDSFMEYSIPLSILRFKQGFGRLIRSKHDRGIVVVLDKRLLSKRYGQQFLESLPPTNVRSGSLRQLPRTIAQFLDASR